MKLFHVIDGGGKYLEVRNIPIFRVHYDRGYSADLKFLDRVIATHEARKAQSYKVGVGAGLGASDAARHLDLPVVTIGHTARNPDAPEPPVYCRVDRLRRIGDVLYADFVHVPRKYFHDGREMDYREIVFQRYPGRSVEIIPNAFWLYNVSLLGGRPPHFTLAHPVEACTIAPNTQVLRYTFWSEDSMPRELTPDEMAVAQHAKRYGIGQEEEEGAAPAKKPPFKPAAGNGHAGAPAKPGFAARSFDGDQTQQQPGQRGGMEQNVGPAGWPQNPANRPIMPSSGGLIDKLQQGLNIMAKALAEARANEPENADGSAYQLPDVGYAQRYGLLDATDRHMDDLDPEDNTEAGKKKVGTEDQTATGEHAADAESNFLNPSPEKKNDMPSKAMAQLSPAAQRYIQSLDAANKVLANRCTALEQKLGEQQQYTQKVMSKGKEDYFRSVLNGLRAEGYALTPERYDFHLRMLMPMRSETDVQEYVENTIKALPKVSSERYTSAADLISRPGSRDGGVERYEADRKYWESRGISAGDLELGEMLGE